MAYITPASLSIKTCFQYSYSLPFFQREYKWELKHFSEMFNDIQEAFLENFDPLHGRNNVSGYTPYFLGSIIAAREVNGKKPLIDGQQRLTSAFIILAFLERIRIENDIEDIGNISTLLYSVTYGSADYKIEFSDTRKAIFDAYLDKSEKSTTWALINAENVATTDEGDKRILNLLREIDQLFDVTVINNIKFFADYFIEKVELMEISVVDEAEAHRVFVTMNDRGLRLGPIELLKGKILSAITNATDTQTAHAVWTKMIQNLNSVGQEEDSLFFRQFMRAKYAETIRGKRKGSEAGDFDLINDGYHRWFESHTDIIGLNKSDDYLNFVVKALPFYVEVYSFIKNAEENFTPGFEFIHYNAIRKYSFQSMVLLSVVSELDTRAAWERKINIVSKFIDLVLTSRTIEHKENNYDNLKHDAFDLMKTVRGKDYLSLNSYIHSEWNKYAVLLKDFSKVSYSREERADVLYLLARVGCYLEEKLVITNKVGFVTYMQRDKGTRTFDIEHLLKEQYDTSVLPVGHGFSDAKDYQSQRNSLGGLILLPRSRNRSLQAKAYGDKLGVYSTENILAQTLTEDFYKSNPGVKAYFVSNPQLGIAAISEFGKSQLTARGNTYNAIAKEIWGKP